ncbi:uncharacterized protein LAESUDRAFT_696004 [Laetiporus sulphureus 93-53]|uniref:separase n=1 Tax=Laetiporus sulphureus 93-53 TaxID=1314785 RepID=A0A165FPY2_9APHY|nr:uncharacterized protein LAESUDRAFT_696004 [Laetiporus sulphureus 93-53]KZT09299.1 hypothetical protein LAESUDRAFT_696004 [Laetiporus sulphureus 93-53]
MSVVNSVSKALSAMLDKDNASRANKDADVESLVASARDALKTLREATPGDVDTERAASSVAGKLVSLNKVKLARQVLEDMYSALIALYKPTYKSSRTEPECFLLLLPLPSGDKPPAEVILTLIATFLLHVLTVYCCRPADIPALLSILGDDSKPSLFSWVSAFTHLHAKHHDALFTRAYSALSRAVHAPGVSALNSLTLRKFALRCLAYTRPGVVTPDMYWDHAVRWGKTYAVEESRPEDAIARTVLTLYVDLAYYVQRREDQAKWLRMDGFSRFCESWIQWASRAGNIDVLDSLTSLLRGDRLKASPRASPFSRAGSDAFQCGCTRNGRACDDHPECEQVQMSLLCSAFACATIILEHPNRIQSGDRGSRVETAVSAVQYAESFLAANSNSDSTELDSSTAGSTARDSVRRSLERLRRVAVKVLEQSSHEESQHSSTVSDSRKGAFTILKSIIDAYSRIIMKTKSEKSRRHGSTKTDIELLTPTLNTLFTLAPGGLVMRDMDSYQRVWEMLERAKELVFHHLPDVNASNSAQAESFKEGDPSIANSIRCIAGAFHNVAGVLYHADRFSHAVRFLIESCELGRMALRMHYSSRSSKVGEDGDDEVWAQLEEQLWRRWELLGVCQAKTGDRKLAYQAFIDCIKDFPFGRTSLQEDIQSTSVLSVFEQSPMVKRLGELIDRVTYRSICDFFMDPRAFSARMWFANGPLHSVLSAGLEETNCIVGALLERQAAGLGKIRWKEGVSWAIAELLKDALALYVPHEHPIRRARVLISLLETGYYVDGEDKRRRTLGSTTEEIGQEVQSLLLDMAASSDSGLSPCRSGYLVTLHLWLAFHAHRDSQQDRGHLAAVVSHAQEACKILKKLLSKGPRPSLMKRSPEVAKLKRRTATEGRSSVKSARGATSRTQRRSRLPMAKAGNSVREDVPVTPKARSALDDQLAKATYVTPPRHATLGKAREVAFDDKSKLISLMRTAAQLLGLLGQILVKVQLLNTARRVCEEYIGRYSPEYVTIALELAHDYVELGKADKAATIHNSISVVASTIELNAELRILLYLRYAEALAASGNVSKACVMYSEATALAKTTSDDEKGLPIAERIRLRAAALERSAIASRAFAMIQHARDDPSASISGLVQSLRLWNRAIDTVSRLRPSTPQKSSVEADDNPFEVKEDNPKQAQRPSDSPLGEQQAHRQPYHSKAFMDGLEWRLSESLLETFFALARAYTARGSPREAECFVQQASELARALNAPAMMSRALARRGEMLLHLGNLEEGYDVIMEAADLVADVTGPDMADIHRLRGEYSQRMKQEDAEQLYADAISMLDDLGKTFSALDGVASARNSLGGSPGVRPKEQALAPAILAAALRQHISLLRDAGDDYDALLKRLASLPLTAETKAEKTVLNARLTLDDVYSQFRADILLSSLAESALIIPIAVSARQQIVAASSTQEILYVLATAETSLWSDLKLIANRGSVPHVRDTSTSLALISALRASLGSAGENASGLIVKLIDRSIAITLRREILEAIQYKLADSVTSDDRRWNFMTPDGTPIPYCEPQRRIRANVFDDSDEEADLFAPSATMRDYWASIYAQYQPQSSESSAVAARQDFPLPSNWTVLHISVTDDKAIMFVTRQRAREEPLVFCLPLVGRRDNEGDEQLAFRDAMDELKDILRRNDEGTGQAGDIRKDDRKARAAWWAQRSALDIRLRNLLQNIEFCWFGAFKTILSAAVYEPAEDIASLRTRIDQVLATCLISKGRKQQAHIQLNDALLKCFSALPVDCPDEELEDLIYFVLDLYQFHGVPVAIAEVDIDHVVIDLRSVLKEHAMKTKDRRRPVEDSHTFLILDKNVQGIPWESLPTLRGQSVSRIPNMDFLMDRIELARRQSSTRPNAQTDGDEVPLLDRITINPRKTFYVLNPSGDLKSTEGRFVGWLKDMKAFGWRGVVGRSPSEQEVVDALTRSDLFIYLGHGGAEQYVRSSRLRHLPRCAATMLWGCSSGALRDMGDFDRIGTPYNYMLAGCPTLVANLWDVTDRDIDKFSQAVFEQLNLTTSTVDRPMAHNSRQGTSVVTAIAQARERCKLKYLTGAAPVIYGIPFYL